MSPSVTVRLLATQSDARLVELARQGHERAFEALVQRHRRSLLAYCRRSLLPDARAEDALQQALLQAWLALQRGAEVRDARAWLYRTVHNTALNALRGSGYDYAQLSDALSGAGAPHEDLDRRIAVREALAGLAALPEQQREALMRTALEGASHADAAAEMGVSEGAVRGLVHRARATLRTAVTAITPMPLAEWAAGAGAHGGATVAEVAVGGGTAGLAGLLAKGGAVAVTAGVLAAGVGTVERQRQHAEPPAHTATAAGVRGAAAPQGARLVVAAAPAISAPAPAGGDAQREPEHRRRHAGARGPRRAVAVVPETPRGDDREDREDDPARHDHADREDEPAGHDRRGGGDDRPGDDDGAAGSGRRERDDRTPGSGSGRHGGGSGDAGHEGHEEDRRPGGDARDGSGDDADDDDDADGSEDGERDDAGQRGDDGGRAR